MWINLDHVHCILPVITQEPSEPSKRGIALFLVAMKPLPEDSDYLMVQGGDAELVLEAIKK